MKSKIVVSDAKHFFVEGTNNVLKEVEHIRRLGLSTSIGVSVPPLDSY